MFDDLSLTDDSDIFSFLKFSYIQSKRESAVKEEMLISLPLPLGMTLLTLDPPL